MGLARGRESELAVSAQASQLGKTIVVYGAYVSALDCRWLTPDVADAASESLAC